VGRFKSALAAAAIVGLIVTLMGCSRTPGPLSRVHAYVGIDTSSGTRPRLAAFAALAARLAGGRLEPDRDQLTLLTVCDTTREFSDGPAPESQTVIQQTIVRAVQTPPAHRGTRPALFWSEVARRVDAETASRVVVVLLSDGDNDDMTPDSRAAIRAAAKRLAASDHVAAVAVIGVNPENRACLRDCFAPLGDRFWLQGPTEMDIDAVLCRIDNGSH
jgi:hypothetical protein